MYIAHTADDGRTQSILEHATETARRCEGMSIAPLKGLMHEIGLTHDIGKYQGSFQKRINGDRRIRAPHALCGAKEWSTLHKAGIYAFIAQYVIAGHHSGLPDCGSRSDTADDATLFGTLKRQCEDYSAYLSELPVRREGFPEADAFISQDCNTAEEAAERFAFFTRYCFSCLTDADWLDTERFCTGAERESLKADFCGCLERVDAELSGFRCETDLQRSRAALQKQAFDKVSARGHIFLMNMPTGSGKTLAAIRFALERAVGTGKRRIIFIIPYNSIIDQTADTFERIFGARAQILRHQSSFAFEDDEKLTEEQAVQMRLATENWDAEIILTTAVQFFESVYGNDRAKLRRLHNMADSILVFDEAHLMPAEYLQPCLQGITHIVKYLGSEALFLTATMPNFPKLLSELAERDLPVVELVEDKSGFGAFAKCKYRYAGEMIDDALLSLCLGQPSALIVVNKRAAAARLYALAKARGCGRCYHLSTYMTVLDRRRVIGEVKAELKRLEEDYPGLAKVPQDRRILLVSTSLIEAGVDLDFSMACRELCGLDSILQAGGRCNREGKRSGAEVLIFERGEDTNKTLQLPSSIARGLMAEYEDISCAACISAYYDRLLFARREDLVKHSLGRRCARPMLIPFQEYANEFDLIGSKTISVAVERDERSAALLRALRSGEKTDMRALQTYMFTVYRYELDDLLRQGAVQAVNGIYCLANLDYYDDDTGVRFAGRDIFI